jgi:hypothetical protein
MISQASDALYYIMVIIKGLNGHESQSFHSPTGADVGRSLHANEQVIRAKNKDEGAMTPDSALRQRKTKECARNAQTPSG